MGERILSATGRKSAFSRFKYIQLDGRSEFIVEFEYACADLNLSPFAPPAARPKHDGGSERGGRAFWEEFCYRADILAKAIIETRKD